MAVRLETIRASVAVVAIALFVAALLGNWLGFGLTLFPGGTFNDGIGLFVLAYLGVAVYVALRLLERFRNPYS